MLPKVLMETDSPPLNNTTIPPSPPRPNMRSHPHILHTCNSILQESTNFFVMVGSILTHISDMSSGSVSLLFLKCSFFDWQHSGAWPSDLIV